MTDNTAPARNDDPVLAPYRPTPASDSALVRWLVPNLGMLVALALLPLVFVTSLPLAAWALATGAWVLNRLGHVAVTKFIDGLPQAMAVGAAGLSMMMRVWTIALLLFFVAADLEVGNTHIGLGREDIAVPGMLLFMLLFTLDIATRSIMELRRYRTGPEATASDAGEGATKEDAS